MTTKQRKTRHDLVTVGWREWVSLPGIGINYIKAKVDTGARTSALHAFRVETYRDKGVLMADFSIHPLQNNVEKVVTCQAEVLDKRQVTDSGGHRERRLVIGTELVLPDSRWPIEITLTNRDSMRFRMLLGRTAMDGRILVDPGASYLLGKRPSSKKKRPSGA